MNTAELNLMRTQIISMISNENNAHLLNEVEKLLMECNIPFEAAPCCYTCDELKQRVLQATASIRAGRGYTAEELKSLHPR